MKVYIVSSGKLNTGLESTVYCVCTTIKLAEAIVKSFEHFGLYITEFDVIGEGSI